MTPAERHFRRRIRESYRMLRAHFVQGARTGNKRAFQDMGRIIGKHAVLGTPRGQRIMGARAIGLFFEDMARKGKSDVQFRLKTLWVVPAVNPVRKKNKRDMIAEVGYSITQYRLRGNPSDSIGGWSATTCHIGGCPILP